MTSFTEFAAALMLVTSATFLFSETVSHLRLRVMLLLTSAAHFATVFGY